MEIANPAALAALAVLGLPACWFDIKERRLPNWLVLTTLAVGLGLAGWQGGVGVLPWHLAHVATALAVGIGLYALGALGAGDAKYYTALAGWFAFSDGLKLLMAVSFAGLVLALGWLIRRKLSGQPIIAKPVDDKQKVPLGVAMAAGALLALLY